MDSKSDDILNVDIDPTIFIRYELDKLTLDNQLDVESALLSEEDNEITEITNCAKDKKKHDLKISVSNVESDAEEQTPEAERERKKDINGNDESSSEENLNQLLLELELSDSDNEAQDEEESKLRERAPVGKRSTRRQNRTDHLRRNERYDRSQFPPGSLHFLSGSTMVQLTDTSATVNPLTFQSNQSSFFNIRETILSLPSNNAVSSPYPVVYEDRRANSIGSPESGYESSITGSPPQVSLTTLVSSSLDLIPETDDDRKIIDFLVENTDDSALPVHNVLRGDTDDRDPEGKIIEIINYLKEDIPGSWELNESSDSLTSDNSRDYVPLVSNTQDKNMLSGNSSPRLRNVETCKRIEYKLGNKARTALREFLSQDEFLAAEDRIYRQIWKDSEIMKPEDIKIIRVVDETDGTSENRTNLHHAVLKSNIEEIFCLVEIQKQYSKPLTDINIRDKYGKTALDYAVENNMTLVVDYLKENTACQNVIV